MNIVEPIKALAGLVVSSGVGSIVGQALRNTIPEDAGRLKKIVMGIGALSLSSAVSHHVAKYVEGQIDEAYGHLRAALRLDKDEIQEASDKFIEQMKDLEPEDDVKTVEATVTFDEILDQHD